MGLKFTDILFIIVVLILLVYGLIYFFRTQRSKEIKELEQRKDEMMSVSIADQLFTLKNMNLSGQTKRKYESLVANWQTITNFQFTEIEAALVGSEQFVEQMNLVRAKNALNQARELLDETESQVNDLHQQLTDLLETESDNQERYEDLLERYQTARKKVMNHSFDFGPAIETLEKNLQLLELDFTTYNEYTSEGDYLEAQDLLNSIEKDTQDLEEILDKIPQMNDQIKNDYEDSLADLRDGYEKMVASQFNFANVNIPEEIDAIQEQLNKAKSEIKNADLEKATTLMDKADREINSLYELMEAEVQAKSFVNQHINQLKRQIDEVKESNRYAGIEVDRISQSYILHNNETDQVNDLTRQIELEENRFMQLNQEIETSHAVYTQIESSIRKIERNVEEIALKQQDLVKSLSNLTSREKDAKANLDMYELDLRNLKRRLEKNNLPGLHEVYYQQFYKVTEEIENLSQFLNRVKVDMDEVDQLEVKLQEDMDQLETITEEIIDSATLTEYMIQHSNRFRYDIPEMDQAIRDAQYYFYEEFRYREALAVIEKALRRVDPEGPTQVRRMYHQEKQHRMF